MYCVVNVVTRWLYCLFRSPTGVPIFKYPPDKYSSHQIMRILLDPNIETAKIAKQRPLETSQSATFVVDVRSLKHRDDIKKDMYGRWIHHALMFSSARLTSSLKCVWKRLLQGHQEIMHSI